MCHLVQENFAAGILEVHVQLDRCTVVIVDLDMFQFLNVCDKLE